MIRHRIHIRLVPQQDGDFRAAFARACMTASQAGLELDSGATADRAEAALRAEGYPTARIDYWRSLGEALEGVAHWFVRRDGIAEAVASDR